MLQKFLKAKIHRAKITQADLNYVGSITIDEALLEASGIKEFEAVWIYNINNGERFETYVLKGERNSGIIGLNGAAARNAMVGDLVIIASYVYLSEQELKSFSPKVLLVDENNRINEIRKFDLLD
ncbi:MAG TPA: aspartate 1-decarboxylase [Exilispira sp.]|nr:aspartate 1-decarboxylase [Exilispira sp.]